MRALLPPRVYLALPAALLVTVLVFLFMQSLIRISSLETTPLPVYSDIQVLHPPKEKPQQEPEEKPVTEPVEQPLMEPLVDLVPSPVAPQPAVDVEMPSADLSPDGLPAALAGERWSAPVGTAGTVSIDEIGEDGRGFIEVVPYSTRRPNVPEAAWRNRVSGWVLVAFSVTPQGKTRGVRVLDARPRGVFEDTVVAAVKDWRYRVNVTGKLEGDVVLTQKVEVMWENFPQNLPNVD